MILRLFIYPMHFLSLLYVLATLRCRVDSGIDKFCSRYSRATTRRTLYIPINISVSQHVGKSDICSRIKCQMTVDNNYDLFICRPRLESAAVTVLLLYVNSIKHTLLPCYIVKMFWLPTSNTMQTLVDWWFGHVDQRRKSAEAFRYCIEPSRCCGAVSLYRIEARLVMMLTCPECKLVTSNLVLVPSSRGACDWKLYYSNKTYAVLF